MGFATDIETFEEANAAPSQCARRALFELVTSARAMQAAANDSDDPDKKSQEAQVGVLMALDKVLSERSTTDED